MDLLARLARMASRLVERPASRKTAPFLTLSRVILLSFVLVGGLLLAWDWLDHAYFGSLSPSTQHLMHMIRGITTGVLVSVGITWAVLSERKRYEKRMLDLHRELIRKERLAAVGELAAGVAHEIRNPLAGIGGSLAVIARDLPKSNSHADIMKEIDRQLHRIERMVGDMLAYARPGELQPKWIHPHAILEQAISGIQQQPSLPEARLVRDLDPEVPEIYGDPRALDQAFGNLILNAYQAVSKGGTIEVRTRRRGDEVRVSIRDDGCGIPPGSCKRIFEPFFTTKARGTGLGLSIVRRAVESHGGTIEVRSEPGKGTVFEVRLPRRLPTS
ncbi:MAG: ATP-binding protein [Acidobacteriota bacterium]